MIHDHLLRIPDAMYGLEDQPQMQTAVKKTLTLNNAWYFKEYEIQKMKHLKKFKKLFNNR